MALISALISEAGGDLSLSISEDLARECCISSTVRVALDKHAGQERREIRVCGRQEEVQGSQPSPLSPPSGPTVAPVTVEVTAAQACSESQNCPKLNCCADIGDVASWRWLSTVLESDVRLVEACKPMLNKESLLIVPRARVQRLNESLEAQGTDPVYEDVFRGNFYVDTEPRTAVELKGSYESSSLRIEDVASCIRCGAVNVDSKTGERPRTCYRAYEE